MTDTGREVVAAAASMQMVFQPIVNLATNRVVGHEALARFRDGQSPEVWIEAAHQAGVGIDVEMLALGRALETFPLDDGFISVNLSPAALLWGPLPDLLRESAAKVQVVLELTEHTPVGDYEPMKVAMQTLRDMGVLLAVDDLGSGFASMRHVLHLRPDIVKLDRSLVAFIDRDDVQRRLAGNLVDFASSIDCDVIAEGIERAEEQVCCLDIGVRLGQGYLFGRPAAPPARATSSTDARRTRPPSAGDR